jgi:hypothetical protein
LADLRKIVVNGALFFFAKIEAFCCFT